MAQKKRKMKESFSLAQIIFFPFDSDKVNLVYACEITWWVINSLMRKHITTQIDAINVLASAVHILKLEQYRED